MPCHKHDGEHDYRECPDNKNRRSQSESKKEKEKSQKKNLHSTKGGDVTTKKTPSHVRPFLTAPGRFFSFFHRM
jgi:hypothetical protein